MAEFQTLPLDYSWIHLVVSSEFWKSVTRLSISAMMEYFRKLQKHDQIQCTSSTSMIKNI